MFVPGTPSEELLLSTVRLEVYCSDGTMSVGTGFFYKFDVKLNGQLGEVVAIITNKHVVEDGESISLRFHHADTSEKPAKPSGGQFTLSMPVRDNVVGHPSSQCDLCAILVEPIYALSQKIGKTPLIRYMSRSIVPSSQQLSELKGVEGIVMIGYPNGIWDSVNNLPVVRRGITGSHPAVNYEGENEGLVDVACFPGSSGSPILVFDEGFHSNRQGGLILSTRIYLLGVLYAGPVISTEGRMEKRRIPTKLKPIPVVETMMHLGFYIRSEEIEAIGDVIRAGSLVL